jgi:surfeit locus 1 family protein
VSKPRGGLFVPGVFAALGLAVLLGLGIWQIERKAWKENLIATLEHRLGAAPVALPRPDTWASLTADNSEFLRVRLRIEPGGEDALVYTSGSALRDDVKAPGYFVFTPARLPDGGTVVINRGYVSSQSHLRLAGAQDIVGVLRWPDAPSWFVADHDSSGIWYMRDPVAIARAKGWGTVAPFYVEQEQPVPPGGQPHPATLHVKLRNDHLQYALTWFGLAAVLAVMFVLWAIRRRRDDPANP